jgi:hypothetical protein
VPTAFAVTIRSGLFIRNQSPSGNQPPAVMGSCGLHEGITCVDSIGSTIDVIPRNIEYFIDSRSNSITNNLLTQCDPTASSNARIPIYAPAAGCATYRFNIKTIEINIDKTACSQSAINSHRLVSLTHLIPISELAGDFAQKMVIAGELVGYLCRDAEKVGTFSTQCNIEPASTFGAEVPTHLAFQLSYVNQAFTTPIRQEVLGFLAISRCVYDNWEDNHTTPTRKTTNQFHACP